MNMPWLFMYGGIGSQPMSNAPAGPRTSHRSSVTGVSSGAPIAFQSGKSSFIALGSITAPDRMWAPTSEPFSSTATEISDPASAASCFRRMAAASPAGPAPTTTTSYSIASRSASSLILIESFATRR